MESDLILSKGGFPPLSARGCIQHLMPILSGDLRRTINGSLIYTGNTLSHKYRSLILCEDKTVLALDDFWRGSEIRVGCIQPLWQKVTNSQVLLERYPIEGSIFAITDQQKDRQIQEIQGRKVIVKREANEDVFLSYRPWLNMRVVNFAFMTNEWGLKSGWRLELEEI
ncbi:MAG: hypothetical protein FJX03_06820 [Alphaproteobacteria bacterium]|nr:hypothetical protein [Alphaproteobacteria bacterium]